MASRQAIQLPRKPVQILTRQQGNEDSFKTFPDDLKRTVGSQLPDHNVETVVYPKYATKGELAEASSTFLEWYAYIAQ